jgi:hypothetical protein
LTGAAATVVILTGCGSGGTGAAPAKPRLVKGVQSPAGALAPSALGLAGLAKLVKVHPDAPGSPEYFSKEPIAQAITTASSRLNQFWSQEFARSGIRWQMILEVLVQSAPVKTPCSTTVPPTREMFLCIADAAGDTFYWTVPWMRQHIGIGSGDMELALGMAALYSDVPLDLFGFRDREASGAESNRDWQQQKFCLAGVYAASLGEPKLAERAGMRAVDEFLKSSAGSGAATPHELKRAFSAGLASGSPGTCARPSAGAAA